jgi:hypothetical protein
MLLLVTVIDVTNVEPSINLSELISPSGTNDGWFLPATGICDWRFFLGTNLSAHGPSVSLIDPIANSVLCQLLSINEKSGLIALSVSIPVLSSTSVNCRSRSRYMKVLTVKKIKLSSI